MKASAAAANEMTSVIASVAANSAGAPSKVAGVGISIRRAAALVASRPFIM
jgi:hypothetical protein